jgi:hypothetical protein
MDADMIELIYGLKGGFPWDDAHKSMLVALESGAVHGCELDAAIQECDDHECLTCGALFCPYGEPLHFHHDGCPCCS